MLSYINGIENRLSTHSMVGLSNNEERRKQENSDGPCGERNRSHEKEKTCFSYMVYIGESSESFCCSHLKEGKDNFFFEGQRKAKKNASYFPLPKLNTKGPFVW